MIHLAPRTQPSIALIFHVIANFLLSLFPAGQPRRLARMSYPGELIPEKNKPNQKTDRTKPRGKYQDIRCTLTRDMLTRHAVGNITYAYTIDKNGVARVGVLDVDEGGQDALTRILAAGLARDLTLFAISLSGGNGMHDGGHIWAIYKDFCPVKDINAQLRQIAEDAGLGKVEIWPGNKQCIRGLFGYHQIKRTRGQLITQAGQVFDLDDIAQLVNAVDLVIGLPTNPSPATPPNAFPNNFPDQTSPQNLTSIPSFGKSSSTAGTQRILSGEQPVVLLVPNDELREIRRKTRETFNTRTEWSNLLDEYGGVEISTGYWSCKCGVQHTHDIQIAITTQNKILSLSNRCGWARPDKALDKFGFYVDRAHNGDFNAAIEMKAREYGYWRDLAADRGKKYSNREQPENVLSSEMQVQRDKVNARRRAQRQSQSTANLIALEAHVATLDLPKRAHQLATFLFKLSAGNALQIRPTNNLIVQELNLCRRTVVSAFRDLEKAGVGKRTGGRSMGGVNEAAIWTWLCAPEEAIHRVQAPAPVTQRELLSVARDTGQDAHKQTLERDAIHRVQAPVAAEPCNEGCTLLDQETTIILQRVGAGERAPA